MISIASFLLLLNLGASIAMFGGAAERYSWRSFSDDAPAIYDATHSHVRLRQQPRLHRSLQVNNEYPTYRELLIDLSLFHFQLVVG